MGGAIVGNADVVGVNAKLFGDYLCRQGFGTVAPEGREHGHGNAAGRSYADARAFGGCRQAGGGCRIMEPEFGGAIGAALLGCGEADTDVTTFLASTLLFLAPVVQVD